MGFTLPSCLFKIEVSKKTFPLKFRNPPFFLTPSLGGWEQWAANIYSLQIPTLAPGPPTLVFFFSFFFFREQKSLQ